MFQSRFTLSFAVVSACAMLTCQTVSATILTFGITPHPGQVAGGFQAAYGGYGDNVTSTSAPGALGTTYDYGMGNAFTPNISITYSHVDNAPAGSTGHNPHPAAVGWSDPVDYLHYQDGDIFWMTFTPTLGYGVDLNSFAIDIYQSGGSLNWKLRQDSTLGTIFASGTELGLTQVGPDRIVTIANGQYFGTVVLEIDHVTGSFGNIGIDDLNFDQFLPPVPEPSTFALLGLGAVGLAINTRRRRATRS